MVIAIPGPEPEQTDRRRREVAIWRTSPEEGTCSETGTRTLSGVVLLLAWQSGDPVGRECYRKTQPEEDDPDTPGKFEPIVQSKLLRVQQAELAESEMMITIEVDGQHRAYLVTLRGT